MLNCILSSRSKDAILARIMPFFGAKNASMKHFFIFGMANTCFFVK